MLKTEHELYIVSCKHENDTQFVSPWCPQHLAREVSWLCLLSQRMGRLKGKHTEGSGARAALSAFLLLKHPCQYIHCQLLFSQ